MGITKSQFKSLITDTGREYYKGTKKRVDPAIAINKFIYDDILNIYGINLTAYPQMVEISFAGTTATITFNGFNEETVYGYIGKRLCVIYDE